MQFRSRKLRNLLRFQGSDSPDMTHDPMSRRTNSRCEFRGGRSVVCAWPEPKDRTSGKAKRAAAWRTQQLKEESNWGASEARRNATHSRWEPKAIPQTAAACAEGWQR